MTELPIRSRAQVIAQRLRVLEMEAAIQRATLAATFANWEQRSTLDWIAGAAKAAGGVLTGPTGKWLLTAVLMRLIRGRRR